MTSPGACDPGRGAHPSQLCWLGQQKPFNKMTRAAQQTFRKLRREGEAWRSLVTEPRHLAFRVAARSALRRIYCRIEGDFLAKVGQEFGEAHGLHHRELGIETPCGDPRRFVDGPGLDHARKACVAGGVKRLSRRREQDRADAEAWLRYPLLLPLADRDAGGPRHFESANEPLLVTRRQPSGGRRIELG